MTNHYSILKLPKRPRCIYVYAPHPLLIISFVSLPELSLLKRPRPFSVCLHGCYILYREEQRKLLGFDSCVMLESIHIHIRGPVYYVVAVMVVGEIGRFPFHFLSGELTGCFVRGR